MEWNRGFSATYYACLVDRATWRDIETFDITDGTITKSASSLIESADVSTTFVITNEKWIRLYMDTRQNGAAAHVALFTGLAVPPTKEMDGRKASYRLDCYSVLKPAEDILLERGYYVPASANGGAAVKNLLSVTPAPIEVDDDAPVLLNTIIAEQGESNLSMALKVLKAINWRIRISGDGTIHICPINTDPVITFDPLGNDAIEPKITMTHDWFSCPNVFRAISDDLAAIARDDDPDSRLSTVTRGREVWEEESSCSLNDGEGIAAYAKRRLQEEQSKAYEVKYNRRFYPDVTITDFVGLHYPEQGLDKVYQVVSQSITLGSGCRTEEQVEYR